MWSKGSLESSYDSNCGRRNFGGRRRLSTSVVNDESVLQIIPSKFSLPLSFMALSNLSISFLLLRNSFSILEESSLEVLSCLFAHSLTWRVWFFFILVFAYSSMFCILGFHCLLQLFILASQLFHISQRAWICCYCTASGSILFFEELFCHWERWLEWLVFPTDGAKLMMQKISS